MQTQIELHPKSALKRLDTASQKIEKKSVHLIDSQLIRQMVDLAWVLRKANYPSFNEITDEGARLLSEGDQERGQVEKFRFMIMAKAAILETRLLLVGIKAPISSDLKREIDYIHKNYHDSPENEVLFLGRLLDQCESLPEFYRIASLSNPTHYQMLGISSRADSNAIKRAYQKRIVITHTDKFPEGSEMQQKAQKLFALINGAYACLKDPTVRTIYDLSIPLEQKVEKKREAPLDLGDLIQQAVIFVNFAEGDKWLQSRLTSNNKIIYSGQIYAVEPIKKFLRDSKRYQEIPENVEGIPDSIQFLARIWLDGIEKFRQFELEVLTADSFEAIEEQLNYYTDGQILYERGSGEIFTISQAKKEITRLQSVFDNWRIGQPIPNEIVKIPRGCFLYNTVDRVATRMAIDLTVNVHQREDALDRLSNQVRELVQDLSLSLSQIRDLVEVCREGVEEADLKTRMNYLPGAKLAQVRVYLEKNRKIRRFSRVKTFEELAGEMNILFGRVDTDTFLENLRLALDHKNFHKKGLIEVYDRGRWRRYKIQDITIDFLRDVAISRWSNYGIGGSLNNLPYFSEAVLRVIQHEYANL